RIGSLRDGYGSGREGKAYEDEEHEKANGSHGNNPLLEGERRGECACYIVAGRIADPHPATGDQACPHAGPWRHGPQVGIRILLVPATTRGHPVSPMVARIPMIRSPAWPSP